MFTQLVSKIFNLCGHDPSTSQTDRQTDRYALHYSASRGKNYAGRMELTLIVAAKGNHPKKDLQAHDVHALESREFDMISPRRLSLWGVVFAEQSGNQIEARQKQRHFLYEGYTTHRCKPPHNSRSTVQCSCESSSAVAVGVHCTCSDVEKWHGKIYPVKRKVCKAFAMPPPNYKENVRETGVQTAVAAAAAAGRPTNNSTAWQRHQSLFVNSQAVEL